MIQNNITYIFGEGRNEKIKSNSNFAHDMFYGYFELNKFFKVNLIETVKTTRAFYKFISKILNKLTGLGIHLEYSLKEEDKKILLNSTEVLFGNQQMLFSLFKYCKQLNKKNININVFAMGLMSGKENVFTKLFLIYLFKRIQRIIFISETEYLDAKNKFKSYEDIFFYNPFGVDKNFWSEIKSDVSDKNKFILFIGNDLNRDYEFLLNLIMSMPNHYFKVISSRIDKKDFNFSNAELIKGDWHSKSITDSMIRDFYSSAFCTIIPLKNSIQPSGQSVCLQSMLCNTPVLISKTDGFWDKEFLIDEENILLRNNEIDLWIESIQQLIDDKNLYSKISENARKVTYEKYTTDEFSKKLIKILDLNY